MDFSLGLNLSPACIIDFIPFIPMWTYVPLTMLAIYPLDRYLRTELNYSDNHRWCYIHSIANMVTTCMTARGAVTLLSSDATIAEATGFNLNASIIVMALHLYHLLMFKIKKGDILMHHIVMMLVLLIPFWNEHNNTFLMFTDYSLFFLCGLPGGIDYYLMHMCYTGKIQKTMEKYINTLLNAYIRAPGILYGAFYIYRRYMNHHHIPFSYMIAVLLTFMWNAQHFFKEVAISYGRTYSMDISPSLAITGSKDSDAGTASASPTANCAIPSATSASSASASA